MSFVLAVFVLGAACVCVCGGGGACVRARARVRACVRAFVRACFFLGCSWIHTCNCCCCFLFLSYGGSKMAHRSLKVEVNSSRSTFLSQLTAVNKVTPGRK